MNAKHLWHYVWVQFNNQPDSPRHTNVMALWFWKKSISKFLSLLIFDHYVAINCNFDTLLVRPPVIWWRHTGTCWLWPWPFWCQNWLTFFFFKVIHHLEMYLHSCFHNWTVVFADFNLDLLNFVFFKFSSLSYGVDLLFWSWIILKFLIPVWNSDACWC